jgi:hypothetical protein
LDAYLRTLVKEQEVQAAFCVLEDLTASCSDAFFAPSGESEAESLERVGVVDALASMPITMLLAYTETLNGKGRDFVLAIAKGIHWNSGSGIYATGLPLYMLERLESLQPRVRFEIESEGKQVSPYWYVGELLLQRVAENTKTAIDLFVDKAQAIYKRWVTAADNQKLLWIGAAILARELEYLGKSRFHQPRLREYYVDLGSNKRIEKLPWPTLDFDELNKRLNQRAREVVQSMTARSSTLNLVKRPDSHPDFAGQFLHAAGEALFKAMVDHDVEAINVLFPDFFRSSLLQFNRIRLRASELDWRSDVAVKVAVAPVLDLMDLTGYAILFSELYTDPAISTTIMKEWSDYLDHDKSGSRISFLAAAISLTDSAFELAHRSLIRTSWRQRVSARLRQLERKLVSGRTRGAFWNGTVVAHDSPIVRIYAEDDFSPYDGIDLFIEKCLRTREDGRGVQLGNRHGRLGDALVRERAFAREESPQ